MLRGSRSTAPSKLVRDGLKVFGQGEDTGPSVFALAFLILFSPSINMVNSIHPDTTTPSHPPEFPMNHRMVAFFALGFLALAGSPAGAQPKGTKGGASGNGWLSSLQEGKRQAAKSGKPIMVVLRCQP